MNLKFLFKTKLIVLALSSSLISCSTPDKIQPEIPKTPQWPVSKPSGPAQQKTQETRERVDLEALKQALGLERAKETLGYSEKLFENCGGKFGFPRSTTCQKLFFVIIHFKIQCRDSEGTVSEVITEEELTPYANQKVKWSLKSINGESRTDRNGFGQIQTLSAISQREQRLKLSGNNDFLYMAAGEIKRVVTPRPFCK